MICVLQVDSPDRSLMERMMDEGRLPVLAGLAARGETTGLDGPQAQFPAAAYPCLYRGVEAPDHGLFYPFQWSGRDGRVRLAEAFPAPPPIWERLAAHGRSTLVIDPYESHEPRRAEGTLVCGWGLRERVVMQRWAAPPSAARRLRARFGPAPDVTETFGRHGAGELLALREAALGAAGRTAAGTRLLLAERSFDVAWLTFAAPHIAGHRLHAPPADVLAGMAPEARGLLREASAAILEATDAAVGKVLEALPDDTDVIVCSALGMGPDTSRADLLPGMLAAVIDGRPAQAEADGDGDLVWRLRDGLGSGVRRRVAAAIPDRVALALTARLELGGIDWSATRAFAQPADNQGYVRLNLSGRERNGVVDPSAAAELLGEIAAGLKTFHDPDGESAVAAVEEPEGREAGRFGDRFPDLVVRWRQTPGAGLVESDVHGTVRRGGYGTGRTGNHTDGDGWAILAPGSSDTSEPGRPARLVDVAATVAAVSGIPDEGLAGRPLLA